MRAITVGEDDLTAVRRDLRGRDDPELAGKLAGFARGEVDIQHVVIHVARWILKPTDVGDIQDVLTIR